MISQDARKALEMAKLKDTPQNRALALHYISLTIEQLDAQAHLDEINRQIAILMSNSEHSQEEINALSGAIHRLAHDNAKHTIPADLCIHTATKVGTIGR